MSRDGPTGTRLVDAAERCADRGGAGPVRLTQLAGLDVRPDESFCRDVADHFDRLPGVSYDDALARRYDRLKRETRAHYQAVLDAGIEVEPWTRPGQPYRDSADLVRSVRRTGRIHVFLTRDGHGPAGGTGFHPMREPSGVTARGVELSHNDLFRVVHDVFGHVMFGHGFGAAGEFKAAYCQMALLSYTARPVVFTEQVAQTCWFFYGPHLRTRSGRLRRPGDAGYVHPRRRPFPEQKVFAPDPGDVAEFESMFELEVAV